jgi:uncharacterized protein YbjT (DUF2867 family)
MSDLIFVSGATGPVGSCVVRVLRQRGARVRAGSRNVEAARRVLGDEVEIVAIAYDSQAKLRDALSEVRRAFVCAPSIAGPTKVAATQGLVDAATASGVERLVVLSGMSAAHDADSVSRRIEQAAERSGLAWTHLRPNHFMQNYGSHYAASIRRGVIDFFTGEGATSLVDARDLGEAGAVMLLEQGHEGKAITLTGPHGLDQRQIARILSRATSRRIEYVAKSHDDTRVALRASGLPEAAIELSITRFAEIEAGIFAPVHPELPALLGHPARTFEAYARENAALWCPA